MKKTPEKPKNGEAEKDSSYPVYDLGEALKIGEAVKELGGSRAPVAKSMVAKKLDYAEKGPSFFQRVGAAKGFGIIDGWGEYSLTQAGKEFFYPTAEGMKPAALVTFLQAPALFKRIVARFNGDKLPDNETLGNIMHTEGVNDGWKERVASLFLRSAQTAGVIDANGFLRCGTGGGVIPPVVPQVPPATPPAVTPPLAPLPKGAKPFSFDFQGKTVLLVVPEDGLHPIQWQALNEYVQSLKPKESKK